MGYVSCFIYLIILFGFKYTFKVNVWIFFKNSKSVTIFH